MAASTLTLAGMAEAREFKVLSYNAMLLSKFTFPNHRQDDRAKLIPQALSRQGSWDVIVYNEAFENEARSILMLNTIGQGYPFMTDVPDKATIHDDSGVFLVSRHPIVETDTLVFSACDGSDCLANKGAVYAKIWKDNVYHHVFATHLQADDSEDAVTARTMQLIQLQAFMLSKAAAASLNNEPVIIAGDLNFDRLHNSSEFKGMLGMFQAETPPELFHSFDPVNNGLAKWRYAGEQQMTLDYVLTSRFGTQPSETDYAVIRPKAGSSLRYSPFGGAGTTTSDLSDHYGISATFRFN
ncbi:sphingomyelin phosphodiesterase [Pseudoponticoccus marisrubri]|nr:sphingomyelin phosphodiesterase [Pseudoponticoccus marisrubri]